MIITQATNVKSEPGYNRFKYLSELLSSNYEVTLVTSDFNHYTKIHRDSKKDIFYDDRFNTVFIHESGYKKNVGFKRILSHYQFAKNLEKYLRENTNIPDAIILGLPPHDSTKFISKYAKSNNVKILIDVNDLWPEAIENVIHINFLYKLLTNKLRKKAQNSYKMADAIVGVSNEYANHAKLYNDKTSIVHSIYIGTFISEFDKGKLEFFENIEKKENEIWIVYIGTLGVSYDLETAISAYKRIVDEGHQNVKFKILGRGPQENKLIRYARDINVSVDFLGYKNYKYMASFLSKSDIALNVLKKKASQSIINKVGDYFSAGLPVINGTSSKEMNALIVEFNCGLNYASEDEDNLYEKMKILINDAQLRLEMGANSRALALKKFNRESTYTEFVEILEKMLSNGSVK